MRPSIVGAIGLLAPLALAACGGSSGPGETPPVNSLATGRFDLITWDAKPLPDTLRVIVGNSSTPGTGSVSCPEILLGATLDLATDGTFTRTSRLTYPCTGTLPRPSDLPDSLTRVETGHVTSVGSSVLLSFDGFQDTTSMERVEYGRAQGADLVIYRIVSAPATVEDLENARVYRHE